MRMKFEMMLRPLHWRLHETCLIRLCDSDPAGARKRSFSC